MAGITKTFDYSLYLDDGGSITASAAGEIGGTDKILDLGSGLVEGSVIVDVTALDVDTGNELVTLGVQISSSATFASASAASTANITFGARYPSTLLPTKLSSE